MADISAATGASTAAATTTTAAKAGQGTRIGADFNTFVRLLVAQAQNQDPLSPQDPMQFTQQLATFSSVEQAIATNAKLDSMLSGSLLGSLGQGAALIGAEVQDPEGAWHLVQSVEVQDGTPRLRTADGTVAAGDVRAVRRP